MAMIRCSECGRAISDRAVACIGCGAPLSAVPGVNWLPARAVGPAPTGRQIARRAALAASALGFGVLWANGIGAHPGGSRIAATLAALLVIVGLCGCVVALLQTVASRVGHSRD
jgi:hypothetical protein